MCHSQVRAAVPSRYCCVAVCAAGGAVEVEGVREAALDVSSGGGAVRLGRIQATTVDVDAGAGGTIEAGEVSGMTVALRAGGPVRGARLVGREVAVRGAPIAFEAALGARIDLDTGGAPAAVEARTLSADASLLLTSPESGEDGAGGGLGGEEGGLVRSHGGPVTLGAVAGAVRVESAGGAVEVHCTLECRDLEVLSGGGDVRCSLAPGVQALVDVAGTSGAVALEGASLRLEVGTELEGSRGGGGGVRGSLSVGETAASAGRLGQGRDPGEPLRLRIRPEGGRVVLRERSWLDGLRVKSRAGVASKGVP